jgi:hypothetical protein
MKNLSGSPSSEISVTLSALLPIALMLQQVPSHFPSKPALSPLERQNSQNEIKKNRQG